MLQDSFTQGVRVKAPCGFPVIGCLFMTVLTNDVSDPTQFMVKESKDGMVIKFGDSPFVAFDVELIEKPFHDSITAFIGNGFLEKILV